MTYTAALANDLNTAEARAAIFDLVRAANSAADAGNARAGKRRRRSSTRPRTLRRSLRRPRRPRRRDHPRRAHLGRSRRPHRRSCPGARRHARLLRRRHRRPRRRAHPGQEDPQLRPRRRHPQRPARQRHPDRRLQRRRALEAQINGNFLTEHPLRSMIRASSSHAASSLLPPQPSPRPQHHRVGERSPQAAPLLSLRPRQGRHRTGHARRPPYPLRHLWRIRPEACRRDALPSSRTPARTSTVLPCANH